MFISVFTFLKLYTTKDHKKAKCFDLKSFDLHVQKFCFIIEFVNIVLYRMIVSRPESIKIVLQELRTEV